MGMRYSAMQLEEYFHHKWKVDYSADYLASRRIFNTNKRVRAAQRQRKMTRKLANTLEMLGVDLTEGIEASTDGCEEKCVR